MVVKIDMSIKFKEVFRNLVAKYFDGSQVKAGSALPVSQQQVSKYLSQSNKAMPRLDTAADLADYFRMSLDELAGRKPIERIYPTSVVVRASSLKNLKDLPERRTELVEIPVVSSKIAAGAGQVPDDRVEDWAWIPVNQLHGHSRDNLVCVRVTGESMDPMIKGGAMVCVDRSDLPEPNKKISAGAIYAVRKKGNLISVKHIEITDHVMVLMSENSAYHPTIVDLRDDPSPVVGRVVWVWQAV